MTEGNATRGKKIHNGYRRICKAKTIMNCCMRRILKLHDPERVKYESKIGEANNPT